MKEHGHPQYCHGQCEGCAKEENIRVVKILAAFVLSMAILVGVFYGVRKILDTTDYSMPTHYTVTSCIYHPARSVHGTQWNIALKMPMPHTYYYSEYWETCGDFIVEGGPFRKCYQLSKNPGENIIGNVFNGHYGFTKYSNTLKVKLDD